MTNARRLAPPSNTGWEIHITPNTGAAVTIALTVTTDCTAKSAICTSDLRPLSNEWEVTSARATQPVGPREEPEVDRRANTNQHTHSTLMCPPITGPGL